MSEKDILEVLIHSSSKPLTQRDVDFVLNKKQSINISKIVNQINKEYSKDGKGYRIEKISGGYQLLSLDEYHYYIERLQQSIKKPRFSKAAMETLSIIAYKQPVTRSEVEHIRGVDSSGVIRNLLDKGLISISGRDENLGRSLLYITTSTFLELFGMDTLRDLPTLEELTNLLEDVELPSVNLNEN